MTTPAITIVTATLNRDSLAAACESINNQHFTNWHHYVLGDGLLPDDYAHPQRSTLGFSTILGRTEISLDKPEGTPNPIFRWAIQHLNLGECLCFLDDDNTQKPDFLERMYTALKQSTAGIAICALEDHRNDNIHDGYPELGRCDTSGFLVYSHIARDIGWPHVIPGEDNIEDFRFIKACADASGWVRVPEKLIHFGIHDRTIPPERQVESS